MEFIRQSLAADWEAFLAFSPRLLYALVVLLAFLLAAHLAGRAATGAARRSTRFRPNERFIRFVVAWGLGSVGVLAALSVLGLSALVGSLLATGGIVAIVLGFAFREIGENFLAGIFLTFSRPFELGDLVQTGDLLGHVREIELRNVHLRGVDGCDYFVPSAQIFGEPLLNYTRDGLRRATFQVGVAYDDQPEEVLELLRQAAGADATVLRDPPPVVEIAEFAANFIVYAVHVWVDVAETNYVTAQNGAKFRCWRALVDAGKTFSSDVTTALDVKSVPQLQIER